MNPQPGTYWRDAKTGTLIRVKAVAGGCVDYESRTRAGWVRADAWDRHFAPAKPTKPATA